MGLGLEPAVRLVNRVVDDDGRKIPYEYCFDGVWGEIADDMLCPLGPARILIHNSMYSISDDTLEKKYKLGCPELGLPTDSIRQSDITSRNELIERHNTKVQTVKTDISAFRQRTKPLAIDGSNGDRAFPGTFSST